MIANRNQRGIGFSSAKGKIVKVQESQIIIFVPTVVNLAIQSCVAMSLLDIPNGGIFKKTTEEHY